ncbi:Six-hairpin glycosidase-like protein [Immersiella caudata]|uniref:Six-hairpin glycosidase-like protein n=1 Tax=Immersiella caudata TaxID=314043 RepID=A0AA39WPB5_9PEZI|nr:Six-hairpin glycosidase-like protein [Immersiella caudata]
MSSGDPRREMIRLNENSFWSGGPLDRINPDGYATVKKMQELILEGPQKLAEAEDWGVQGYTGTPMSTRHYYKMGNLKLTQTYPNDGAVSDYERWLGIDDAVAGAHYTIGNITYQREYLASSPDNIIAVRIRASKPGSINIRIRIDRGSDLNRYQGWSVPANGHSTITGGQTADADPIVWAVGGRIASKGGKVSTLGDTVRCVGADEATVYIQSWTSYRKEDPKQAVIDDLAAVTEPFETIREAHVKDYKSFFDRVSINLGTSSAATKALKTSARVIAITAEKFDGELASLYFQLGRYLLIASSRPEVGGKDLSLPPNLQGIWNDVYHPVWGSKYTVNINLQMNYWPSLVTGLSDLVQPLNNLLKTMDKRGQEVAKKMYNASGTVTHHNTDIWGDSAPQDDYLPGTFWPMGATWMITHAIEHFRFTGDKEMLRDMFPTIKNIAQFALDFLTPHKKFMVTNPSSSPENAFLVPGGVNNQQAAICPGPTVDNELLWEVFGFIPEAQAALGIKDEGFAKKVKEMKGRLPPMRINQYGGIAEWMEDYEEANPGNGHMSHLVPVYPLTHITPSNKTLFSAAITSLRHRLDAGGGTCGWPRVWTVALAGRLFLPDIAHKYLAGQINSACTWNRTMLNMGGAAPFQIDGSLGAPGAMVESLVQSHENVVPAGGNGTELVAAYTGEEGKVPLIRLLPAVPKEWARGGGFVKGVKTRGGYSVDVSWNGEGVLESAELTSMAGNVVYVTLGTTVVGGEKEGLGISVEGGGKGAFVRLEGEKGKTYKISLGK